MSTNDDLSAALTGQVMFYRKPEPLTIERHRRLGGKRVDKPYAFLTGAHFVPLTVNEFGFAAGSFPIIFIGPEKSPVAVMGARPGENIFINAAGDVDPEIYLPAFVRRYPFVFAKDEQNQRLILCVDVEAPMIGENPDIPFFKGEEATEYVTNAMTFCQEFEQIRGTTELFVKSLVDLDLFEEKQVVMQPRNPDGSVGEPQAVASYTAISEEKVAALPTDAYLRLREQGALPAIYAHLVSLLTWPKIIQRSMARQQQDASTDFTTFTPMS
jgi:hypothetical protein